MSEQDGRQWTLQREPDRDVVHGPFTGDEVVTVVPVEELDRVKVDRRPEREAALLVVNADQADRIRRLTAQNSRLLSEKQQLLREREDGAEDTTPAPAPVQEQLPA